MKKKNLTPSALPQGLLEFLQPLALLLTLGLTFVLQHPAPAQERPVLVPQLGNARGALSPTFSPDGRWLVSAGDDWQAIIWDYATGSIVRRLMIRGNRVIFSADGKYMASSGGGSPVVMLWNASTWTVLRVFDVNYGTVAFSPDSSILAMKGIKKVQLYDLRKGILKKGVTSPEFDNSSAGIAYSPDGRYLALCGIDGAILICDGLSGAILGELKGYGKEARCLAFSPDGFTLASGADANSVLLWSVSDMQINKKLTHHTKKVAAVAFSPDGQLLATETENQTALVDALTGEIKGSYEISGGGRNLTFSPNGKILVCANGSNLVFIDTATLKETGKFNGTSSPAIPTAFTPNGSHLMTGGQISTLLDAISGNLKLLPIQGISRSDTFSSNGKIVAKIRHSDYPIALLDTRTGEVIKHFDIPSPSSLSFSPDNKTLASGYNDGSIVLWNIETGEPRMKMTGHKQYVNWIRYNPNGLVLASLECDSMAPVLLWSVATGEILHKLEINAWLSDLVFTNDGRYLILSDTGNQISIFDVISGQKCLSLECPNTRVGCLAVSPDDQTLAVGMEDGFIWFWNLRTCKLRNKITAHTAWITGLTFSPDGQRLASVSSDGSVRLWHVPSLTEMTASYCFDMGKEWLTTTPEGYYDGSLNVGQYIRWRIGDQLYPAEQFEAKYKRPDLIAAALRGEVLPTEPTEASYRRTPPRVTIECLEGTEEIIGDSAKLRITVVPGSLEAIIQKIELGVNGRLIRLDRTRGITIASKGLTLLKPIQFAGKPITVQPLQGDGKERRILLETSLTFLPREEKLSIFARVSDDQELAGVSPLVTIKRKAGVAEGPIDLHLLAVGVSQYAVKAYNLNYADADARELAVAFEAQAGKMFRKVDAKILTNSEATDQNVRAGLQWLKEKTGPNDLAIVVFSGHGVKGKKGKLFFLPYNGRAEALEETSVAWTELDDAMQVCQARQILMFMDCCHAGAFGENRVNTDELADRLVKKAGVMVFASSRGNEASLEDVSIQHGFFTKAVLEGLTGKADPYKRGYVTITALMDYVSDTVSRTTNGQQHPWLPRAEQFDTQLRLAKIE